MLGKILLTLAVIAIAYIFVRQRNLSEASAPKPINTVANQATGKSKSGKSEFADDFRLAAYLFLIFMVGIGAALYYFRWQDDHTVLTVNLHRENQTQPVSYEVYKYQLQDRAFITIDGTRVTVAGSERMEIIGLEE